MLESISKMKEPLVPAVFLGLLSALSLLLLGYGFSTNFQLPVYSVHPTHSGGYSLDTLHLAHGAFESWIYLLPASPFVASLLLGVLLTIIIDRFHSDRILPERWICLIPTVVLFLIAGNDIVVFSGALVFVLYLLCVRRIVSGRDGVTFLAPIVLALTGTLIAQELSLPLAVLACISGLTLFTEKKSKLSLQAVCALALLCLIPELSILVVKKEHIFPHYPMKQQIHPVVTAFGPLHVIDRNVIRALWGPLCQLLLLLVLCAGLFQLKTRSFSSRSGLVLVLVLLLCLDTSVPEEYSQLAPLSGVARLFPDLYFIPVAPVLAAVTVVLINITMSRSLVARAVSSAYLFTIPLVYPLLPGTTATFPLVESFIERSTSPCLNSRVATSPSYATIKKHSLEFLCNGSKLPGKLLLSEKHTSVTTSLKNRPKRAKRIVDGDRSSRWHSRQLGNEWIELSLSTPRTIAGIQLRQNKWPGNTPATLQVKVGRTCEASELTQVLTWNAEQKSTLYLTNDGYPFAEQSSEAAGLWPPVKNVRCIRIEQSGKAKHPWSITGIEVIEFPTAGL